MSVKLLEERQLFRRLEVTLLDSSRTYLLEWLAGVGKYDTVAVDGQVVAAGPGYGKSQNFRFKIGSQDAMLAVKLNMMKKVTYLKLILDGKVIYTEGEAQSSTTAEELEQLRSPLQPPKLVRSTPANDAVELSYRSSRSLGVLAIFVAVLFAIVVFWIGPGQSWIFILGCVLICLAALYYGLVKILNRTQIHLDRQNLTVRSGPLPTTRKKELKMAAGDINHFSVQEISRRDHDSGTTKHFFLLQAQGNAAKPVVIEKTESQPSAVYMQNELNQLLKSYQPAGAQLEGRSGEN